MKKSWKRRLKLILCIGFPLGIILGVVQTSFKIDRDIFLKYYTVVGILVVLVAVVVNLIYNFSMQKKIQKISLEMLDGINVEENISKLITLYEKCYTSVCKGCISINLSVAYSDKGDYKKALEALETTNVHKLPRLLQVVYYVDQAYFNFMLGNDKIAKQISDESQKIFQKFRDSEPLKFSFKINDAYSYFASGEVEKATKALEEAEQLCSSKREEKEYQLAVKNIL